MARKFFIIIIFFLSALLTSPLCSQQRIKIAVWGDSRENLDNGCSEIADVLLHKIIDWDFQVHTGDFTHDGTEESWQRTLQYGGIDSIYRCGKFYLCTSNHDFKTDSCTKVYDRHTAGILPINAVDRTTHFYCVDTSNVHVIFCDGYITKKRVMQRWLDSLLATMKKTDWIIGVWHNPTYGDLTYKESYEATCMPWVQSLYKHGCKFILNGHAHLYERTKPLRPDGTVDEKNGIIHIINGAGGASWQKPAKYTAKTAFTPRVNSFPCITFLTIEGDTAVVSTIDARPGHNLDVIDQCTVEKK